MGNVLGLVPNSRILVVQMHGSDTLYPARYPVIPKLGSIRPLMRCCMEAFQAIKLLRKNKYWRASSPQAKLFHSGFNLSFEWRLGQPG